MISRCTYLLQIGKSHIGSACSPFIIDAIREYQPSIHKTIRVNCSHSGSGGCFLSTARNRETCRLHLVLHAIRCIVNSSEWHSLILSAPCQYHFLTTWHWKLPSRHLDKCTLIFKSVTFAVSKIAASLRIRTSNYLDPFADELLLKAITGGFFVESVGIKIGGVYDV